MEYMPGTLSPEEMAQMQMFAEALRAPGVQQSSFNPSAGGLQMPQQNVGNAFAGGVQMGKPFAVTPTDYNRQIANQYGTTAGSQQTNILAAQDAAFL
jgi:hypothetical protein